MWEPLTFELQTLHADLFDVRRGAHVILPDFGVDAQMSNMKDQERWLLLLSGLLQGQQRLEEEPGNRMRRPCWKKDQSKLTNVELINQEKWPLIRLLLMFPRLPMLKNFDWLMLVDWQEEHWLYFVRQEIKLLSTLTTSYLFDFEVEENIDCVFSQISVSGGQHIRHLHLLLSKLCLLWGWLKNIFLTPDLLLAHN